MSAGKGLGAIDVALGDAGQAGDIVAKGWVDRGAGQPFEIIDLGKAGSHLRLHRAELNDFAQFAGAAPIPLERARPGGPFQIKNDDDFFIKYEVAIHDPRILMQAAARGKRIDREIRFRNKARRDGA